MRVGRGIRPSERAVHEPNVPTIRFHDLRQTHGSLLITERIGRTTQTASLLRTARSLRQSLVVGDLGERIAGGVGAVDRGGEDGRP